MTIEPYKAEHLLAIRLQPAQEHVAHLLTPELAKGLERCDAYTVKLADEVVMCAGAIKVWQGRYLVWSYISSLAGCNFIAIHRAVKKYLKSLDAERIEATVDCDFDAGHRWVALLGFEKEAERMRKYRSDGGDCSLYARVKK